MNTFVTGANGFIGSRVTAALVERGHRVRVLLRPNADVRRIDHLPLERVVGDMHDAGALERGLDGCEACVHLAGPSSWSEIDSPEVHEVVVGGTRNLLAAAGRRGIRLVYVSSVAAVNGSRRPDVFDERSRFELAGSGLVYATAKLEAEQLVLAAAPAVEPVVVCPAETYGPDDHEWVTAGALRDALKGWPALAVRGGTAVVHVDDVAEGIVAALEKGRPGERYILGGDNLTVQQLVRLALEVSGQRKPVLTVPGWVLSAVVALCAAARIPPPVPPGVVGYATRYWFVSCDKARRELGYRPREARATVSSVVQWLGSLPAEPEAGTGRASIASGVDDGR